MAENTGTEFLKQRFPRLATSAEVKKAAKRTQGHTDLEVPRDPDARIQNYLERFKEIINRDDPHAKDRGITALKKVLVDRYVVRVEDIPESHWTAQMRVIRNRGESGDLQDLPEEEILKLKQNHLAQAKEDQKGSIEEWIDYLASEQSSYLPDHLKYWVFAGILRLERYEKAEKDQGGNVIKPGRFPERPSGKQRSVKVFPEVNENGLKFIASAYKQQTAGELVYWGYNQDIPDAARQSFLDALSKKDFRTLYGWTQEYLPPISEADMKTTEGQWFTFSKAQGHSGKEVAAKLAGKGTGWCIAGSETAQGNYLDQGADLNIFFTRNANGEFTNPRVVIVTQANKVTEVRGIEWEENIDDYIKPTDIIGNKLKELPGGEKFFEIDKDTKRLTTIDRKMNRNETLTGDELAFLYEVDRPIEYFGYKKDPRIAELREKRNPDEDMSIVFDCERSQIAHNISEVGPETKAYVGPLYPGIFDQIQRYNIEHVYTSFPEGKIRLQTDEIGGKTKNELKRELEQANVWVSSYVTSIIDNPDFTTLPTPQQIQTVRLTVQDLGFNSGTPTTDQIYKRATELGLELSPAELGPHRRLKDVKQSRDDWYSIAMKPIADSDGSPSVFHLTQSRGGLEFSRNWAGPGSEWSRGDRFVFSLRKPNP